jgi:hypothetical protein
LDARRPLRQPDSTRSKAAASITMRTSGSATVASALLPNVVLLRFALGLLLLKPKLFRSFMMPRDRHPVLLHTTEVAHLKDAALSHPPVADPNHRPALLYRPFLYDRAPVG